MQSPNLPPPSVPEIEQWLKTTELFQGFPADLIQDMSGELQRIRLAKDAVLFRQGDIADAIYLVLTGTLRVTVKQAEGHEQLVGMVPTGQPVGEIQVLTGGKRTASVYADTDVVVLKIPRATFELAISRVPHLINRVTQIIQIRLQRELMLTVLPPLVGPLDDEALRMAEEYAEWVYLQQGECLFSQGDAGGAVYLVMSGHLYAILSDHSGNQRVLNDIGRGEIIGEIAFFTHEARTASIFASRDSILIRFNHASFTRLSERYPNITQFIIQMLIRRLRTRELHQGNKGSIRYGGLGQQSTTRVRWSSVTRKISNIAIIPLSDRVPVELFAQKLETALRTFGKVLVLTAQRVDAELGNPGISQSSVEDPLSIRLTAWLDRQELLYQFVVYVAEPGASAWTQRCVRQADRILLAGMAHESPALRETEDRFLAGMNSITSPPQSLVLIHPNRDRLPSGTRQWIDLRPVENHFHIVMDRQEDFERLARVMTGHAVGLVLGGGGARGLAHLGVYRALQEIGIPIDIIGGTSMGAIAGAQIALQWNWEQIRSRNKVAWVDMQPASDYTIPMFAFLKSHRADKAMEHSFETHQIEDTWINFFCVSSNLTTAEIMIHREGPLAHALRASSSLPGVFVPVIDGKNILVDGAVFNNLPGNLVREFGSGFNIVINVSPEEDLIPKHERFPSAWGALKDRFLHGEKNPGVPTIFDTIIRSLLLSSTNVANSVQRDADLYLAPPVNEFGMLEFTAFEQIMEAGYRYSVDTLKYFKLPWT